MTSRHHFFKRNIHIKEDEMLDQPDEKLCMRPPSPNGPGLTLSWHNLTVWVRKKNEEKSTWFSTRYYDAKILRKGKDIF